MKTTTGRSKSILSAAMALVASVGILAAEHLDRGVVAVPTPQGHVYVGWRLLASDAADVSFNVLRSETPDGPKQRLNEKPIVESCNFVDTTAGGKNRSYVVQPIGSGARLSGSKPARAGFGEGTGGFFTIQLQGNYRAQKVGLADLDGDGVLDYLVKQPDFNTDPYQQPGYWKKSEDTYKLDLTKSVGRGVPRRRSPTLDRRARHLQDHQDSRRRSWRAPGQPKSR